MTDNENLSDQLKKLEIELSNCEMEIKAASANVLSTTGDMQAYWMREEEAYWMREMEALSREEEALRRKESLLLTRIIAAEARGKSKGNFTSYALDRERIIFTQNYS